MQKVLGIVCLQLLVTALVAALFYLCEPVKVCTFPLLLYMQQDHTHPCRAPRFEHPATLTDSVGAMTAHGRCLAQPLPWQQIMQ